MSDIDLHRLIIKMLIDQVLEEEFVSTRVKEKTQNICVYIALGKRYNNLMQSKLSMFLSAGVDTRKREQRTI